MSGWQPWEITWGKIHLVPCGVCPTSSSLPWCMGWDGAGLLCAAGKRESTSQWVGKGSSAPAWVTEPLTDPRENHHFPCKTAGKWLETPGSFSNPQDLTAQNLMQISTCHLCQQRNHPAHREDGTPNTEEKAVLHFGMAAGLACTRRILKILRQ